MEQKTIKTPKYWEDENVFGKLTEVETAYGHKVMIPMKFTNGWETSKLVKTDMERLGLDPLDGLETHKEVNPLYYDLVRVFYEIYEKDA